jgi:hypothetical protein
MKIRSVGGKLFYSDGQEKNETDTRTDMIKIRHVFRNFANAHNFLSILGTISNIKPIFIKR